jgi:hypothetical protein
MRPRKLAASSLALVAGAAIPTLAPHAAGAGNCVGNIHGYGIVQWLSTGDTYGVRSTFAIPDGYSTNPTVAGNDVGETIWEGTDGSPNLAHWVEMGYRYGRADPNSSYAGLHWYWADDRPGGGVAYHYHDSAIVPIAVGQDHQLSIQKESATSSTWDLYIDGNLLALKSTNNPGPSYWRESGLETHNTCDYLAPGGDGTLGFISVAGSWVDNWNGSQLDAPFCDVGNDCHYFTVSDSWITQGQKISADQSQA